MTQAELVNELYDLEEEWRSTDRLRLSWQRGLESVTLRLEYDGAENGCVAMVQRRVSYFVIGFSPYVLKQSVALMCGEMAAFVRAERSTPRAES